MTRDVDWLIAPDSFKGTFSAREVALAIAAGATNGDGEASVDICPIADGGEGTLNVLVAQLRGRTVDVPVSDPLGRPITAKLGWVEDGSLAIVEVAGASGLCLLALSERDAEAASTFGTGELIAAAVAAGASHVAVAAGGSASTDGGAGAIEALESRGRLRGAELTVLADVNTPFERAAAVFGPQKGADDSAVERLTVRLHAQAEALPRDPRGVPMGGAAGGLAGGLWARYGAQLVPGAAWVLDAVGFDARLRRARAVITGEGRLDAQTLEGKAISEIACRCARAGVPLHAIVGSIALGANESERLALASLLEATDLAALERAGRSLARTLCPR
ncbi:MAG: glycerate kinase [Solirubrobacteraceae bacterium]